MSFSLRSRREKGVLVKRKSSKETKNEGRDKKETVGEVKKSGNGYREEGTDGYSSNQRYF